ncbi:MAG: triacylglycerol lipase [Deltaproteobacteria bacterium]|nr:triacylglycerol lipase [Deltaproteobacteria bacterium]
MQFCNRTNLFILLAITMMTLPTAAYAGGSTPPKVGTKYPIVLAHGFSGFDSLLGIDYFYQIAGTLRNEGHKVYTTEVSAFNSVQTRGNQLADQIEQILAISGAQKVIIVGHSMGGLDARYATRYRLGSSKVAAVVTVATPHRGAVMSDLIYPLVNTVVKLTGPVGDAIAAFVSSVGGAIVSGKLTLPQDVVAGLRDLTSGFTSQWNQVTTNVPGVLYWSYGGTSIVNISLDPTDALMFLTGIVDPVPNDGLVNRESAKWGTVKNVNLNANHLDEVNQLLGSTGWFDAKGFFKGMAAELKNLGY